MTEPYVVFYLSRALHTEFNYLTAREVFEDYFPAGRLLQALGCYSVVRGNPDKNALRATTEILVRGENWLVIFPEGVAVGLGNVVMPFQPGIGQFGFRAYEELIKKGENPSILYVPIAIKTFYLHHMGAPIDRALRRLEARLLPVHRQTDRGPTERLRALGEALLQAREKEYHVVPLPSATLAERITIIKEKIIATSAHEIGIEDHPDQIMPDRLRNLINALDRMAGQQKNEGDGMAAAVKKIRRRLETAVNFMALDQSSLGPPVTTESFLDMVGLLEREVFGRRRFWGPRRAVVRVGDPVDVMNFADKYRQNRKEVLQEVVGAVEEKVRKMIKELSLQAKPRKILRGG